MNVKTHNNTEKSRINKPSPNLYKAIIIVLSVLLYGQTLSFDFALDDESFYTQNTLVQRGLKSIVSIFTTTSLGNNNAFTSNQPYRPLPILSFALEHQLWGNNPAMSHLINLVIYGILLMLLFNVLSLLFTEYNYILLTIITLIYATHPLHVEVVSNIKSRDELLAALFGLWCWQYYLMAHQERINHKKYLFISSILFFLSMLCKESAVMFLGILPLSYYLLKQGNIKSTFASIIPLSISIITFLLLRKAIIQQSTGQAPLLILDNVLNAATSMSEQIATRLLILYLNIKMLILPYPLSWDYSCQQVYVTGFNNLYVITGIIIYLLLIISVFYFAKRDSIISFCVLFYLGSILPTSNIMFINSANFSERFLFTPSLSIVILISYLIIKFTKSDTINFKIKTSLLSTKLFLTIIIVFSVITIKGASYWKNNLTLFERGIITSPNSSKTHYNLGQEYWKLAKDNNTYSNENNYSAKALTEFKKSIAILPGNFLSVTNLACVFELTNQLDSAIYYFNESKKLNAKQPPIELNISAVYFKKATQFEVSKMIDSAETNYKNALKYNPMNNLASTNLALSYFKRNNSFDAFDILKKAIKYEPKNVTLLETISAMYFLNKEYNSAIAFGTMGLKIDPQSKKIIGVLADANHAIGKNDEVVKYQNMMNSLR